MRLRKPADDQGQANLALSDLLRTLCEGEPGPVRVRDIVDQFGHRAFGAVLFIFAVPNCLPLPPGSSFFLGAPLVIFAPQLAIGARRPWLPRFVAGRTIERATLDKAFSKVIPTLERLEKLLAPRLEFVFGPIGDRLIGLICFVLSLVLILPIPGGNMLPALAISIFALSMTQRDGAFALFGYALTGATATVLVLMGGALVRAVEAVGNWLGNEIPSQLLGHATRLFGG
jgi:hypothetical protein